VAGLDPLWHNFFYCLQLRTYYQVSVNSLSDYAVSNGAEWLDDDKWRPKEYMKQPIAA
jgi:hypothetical protein